MLGLQPKNVPSLCWGIASVMSRKHCSVVGSVGSVEHVFPATMHAEVHDW